MGFSNGIIKELNWDVNVMPLAYASSLTKKENIGGMDLDVNLIEEGKELGDSYFALNRNDDGRLISVHKGSYNPLSNKEFVEFVENFSKATNLPLEGYSEFKNGNVILAFLVNNKSFEINGHQMKDYVVIGNSHDGSRSTFIGTTTQLIRCTNAFSTIMKQGVIRHTANRDDKMDELLKEYRFYFKQRTLLLEGFRKMKKHVVAPELRESLVDKLLDIKDREEMSTRKKNIMLEVNSSIDREMNDLGENLWGFFNGITYYTTHVKNIKDKAFGAVVGADYNINKKAHEICLNQMIMS